MPVGIFAQPLFYNAGMCERKSRQKRRSSCGVAEHAQSTFKYPLCPEVKQPLLFSLHKFSSKFDYERFPTATYTYCFCKMLSWKLLVFCETIQCTNNIFARKWGFQTRFGKIFPTNHNFFVVNLRRQAYFKYVAFSVYISQLRATSDGHHQMHTTNVWKWNSLSTSVGITDVINANVFKAVNRKTNVEKICLRRSEIVFQT